MHEHEYEFEELPLLTREGGYIGAFLDGTASISFEWCDAGYMDWGIDHFVFEGYKTGSECKTLFVTAESDPELFKLLEAALEKHFGEHIVEVLHDAFSWRSST